jgi:hypothetical protein
LIGVVEQPLYNALVVIPLQHCRTGIENTLFYAPRGVSFGEDPVTIEGVRTGFNRLEVVRIKRDGEDWPPRWPTSLRSIIC